MNTATIQRAPATSLRQILASLRAALTGFAGSLHAAQDRTLAVQDNAAAPLRHAGQRQQALESLFSLAARADAVSPNLAAELRFLASRG